MITSSAIMYIHPKPFIMFYNIPQIISEYSLDFLMTFPGMFEDIPRNA